MDIRQSDHYSKYMHSIGWTVEKANGANIFIRKLGPTSVVKIQRPEKIDLTEINKITKKYRPILIKIEPQTADQSLSVSLRQHGYILDKWPLLPTKTLILDLDLFSLDSLPKDTRYEIRQSMKNSLSLREGTDTELFYKLLQDTMKLGGWSVPIKKMVTNLYQSFQPNNSALLFVYQKNEPVAACLLIWHEDTAHYMYAALTQKGRELGAAYFLLNETIKFCQEKELKYLDLEGLYDERYPKQNPEWQGFTKFKMGWHGKVVFYPESFVKYGSPIIAWLFKLTT